MFHYRSQFGFLFLLMFLCACGGGDGENQKKQTSINAHSISITGVAAKGALDGATIEVYELNQSGELTSQTPIATTTTNEFGAYAFSIPEFSTPLLIQSRGGRFIDESDTEPDINLKRSITFTEAQGLHSILFPGQTTSAITILTSSIVDKSRAETFGSVFYATLNNNRDIAINAYGFDPFLVSPSDTINPDVNASSEAMQYAALLGGIANVVNFAAIEFGFSEANFVTVEAIIKDLSDGKIDGRYQAQPIEIQGPDGSLLTLSQDIDFNAEISRFQNNNPTSFGDINIPEVDETILSEPQPANQAPIINLNTSYSVVANQPLQITASIEEPEQQTFEITWQQIAGPIAALENINSDTINLIAPIVRDDSEITLQITVTDALGGISTKSTIVFVSGIPNIPPTLTASASSPVDEGKTVTLNAQANDEDGEITLYNWSQITGPVVTLNNPTNAIASFIAPEVTQNETLTFAVTVTDNEGATVEDTVNIVINNVNKPPVVNAGIDQTINEGDTVTLQGIASDTDGTISTYQWQQISGLPTSISNSNQPIAQFIAPEVTVTETLVFTLTVTDNEGVSAFDEIRITVNNVNKPPTVTLDDNQIVNEGDTVSLTANGSDPDGTIMQYFWSQLSGPTVDILNGSTQNASFIAPEVDDTTTITMQITVFDNQGLTATATTNIIVNNLNIKPIVDAGNNKNVNERDSVTITAIASDEDGTIESYQWQQISGISVNLLNADTQTLLFSAPSVSSTSQLEFSVTVTDNDGDTATDTVTVTVFQIVNQAPTVDAGIDLQVFQGDTVTVQATANDPDGTIISYAWSQVTNEPIELVNANTNKVTFQAPEAEGDITITLRINVVDNGGLGASDTVNITVLAQTPGLILWQQPLREPLNIAPLINQQGDIIVAELDGTVTAFSKGGHIQWQTHSQNPPINIVQLDSRDNVYITGEFENLVSLNKQGKVAWIYPYNNVNYVNLMVHNQHVELMLDGVINRITQTGDPLDKYELATPSSQSLRINHYGDRYIKTDAHKLIHLGANNETINEYHFLGKLADHTSIDDKPFIVTDNTNEVFKLDKNHKRLSLYQHHSNITNTPKLDNDENLLFIDEEGIISKVTPFDEQPIWQYHFYDVTQSDVLSLIIQDDNSQIYVSNAGMLFSLDEKGQLLWQRHLNHEILLSSKVDKYGQIYLLTKEALLIAVYVGSANAKNESIDSDISGNKQFDAH